MLHIFDSTTGKNANAVSGTGLNPKIIRDLLSTGDLYLGRFTFTRVPLNPEDLNYINVHTLTQLLELFKTYKLENSSIVPRGRPPSTTPAITIIRIADNSSFDFNNIRSARTWLSKVAGTEVSQETILRRIKSQQPLNGYLYKLNSKSPYMIAL